MKRRALVSLAAVAALLLSTGRASAEEDPGVHLRFGAAMDGGPFIVPGFLTLMYVGLQGQVGVQFNKFLGLYVVGDLGWTTGESGTSFYGGALLLEFTSRRLISIAAGPEVHHYDVRNTVFFSDPVPPLYLYGGKLRFAWSFLSRDRSGAHGSGGFGGAQRLRFDLGLDVRVLRASAGFHWEPIPSGIASAASFALVPTLNLGMVVW